MLIWDFMKKVLNVVVLATLVMFFSIPKLSADEVSSSVEVEYLNNTSYIITTIEEGEEVSLNYNSRSNATVTSPGSSPISKRTYKVYKTEVDGSASVHYGYSYELYKYKTGSRYYYMIKNPKYLTCKGGPGVTCKGGPGVTCKGYFNFEIKNSTKAGGRSYMYATPILTGYKNMLVTNKAVVPYNTN